jgi:hypothetical protein
MKDPASSADALRASVAARDAIERSIAHQVAECRGSGISWAEIAEITGVSKATALTKWKEPDMTAATAVRENTTWDYVPRDSIRRRDLHDRFGGNRQSGISPARGTSEIFLFTGNHGLFGYADEALPDGRYRYSGEGLHRDQEMTRGNRAILEHAEHGNRLRLLRTLGGGMVEYLGEYEYESHRMLQRQDPKTLQSLQHIEFTLRELPSNMDAER